jgi:hypothetical protein
MGIYQILASLTSLSLYSICGFFVALFFSHHPTAQVSFATDEEAPDFAVV